MKKRGHDKQNSLGISYVYFMGMGLDLPDVAHMWKAAPLLSQFVFLRNKTPSPSGITVSFSQFSLPLQITVAIGMSSSPTSTMPAVDVADHSKLRRLINRLKNGVRLNVHCRSKDDDIDLHVLEEGNALSGAFTSTLG
ncbi:plant self-incompatibility protein S1 family [Striga asiatica]|uniref:Plant self-incompatibility protein S1 family n=1 Tax=Striga asiatica TaxID=4170 RepID=A0A5A7Q430_STRAF|nr:plant self-incompatibility protein S1 family [Striga asiatica]